MRKCKQSSVISHQFSVKPVTLCEAGWRRAQLCGASVSLTISQSFTLRQPACPDAFGRDACGTTCGGSEFGQNRVLAGKSANYQNLISYR